MNSSKENPLVTYILLSYNHRRFLQSALESILNQNYSPIEIIVIDDGSTDGSLDLLRELNKDGKFRLIEKSNGGVVSSVNLGVPLASGEFIVLHASDDISHPLRTNVQIQLLLNNPDLGFTAGGIQKISENGVLLEPYKVKGESLYNFEDFCLKDASVPAVSCMYRADAIKKALPLNEKLVFEDLQLYWKVTELWGPCLYSDPIPLVDYRIVSNSLGRADKVKLFHNQLAMLESYSGRPWYKKKLLSVKSELFIQLAIRNKRNAISFLLDNWRIFLLKNTMRGILVLALPASIIERLRKKY